jgi:serine/threonine protein kinase
MRGDRWTQLQEIFDGAQACAQEERQAFVANACAGDDALQAEVLSLLASADGAREFLATSALDRLANEFARGGRTLRPGERVGAYVIDRLLGSGGGGEVWRARDERLQRDVAIKVLPAYLSHDSDRLHRFAEEARSASALNHPNILVVHDVGEHHGAPFFVTECLDGQSLRERLAAGPLAIDDAIATALGIARGLAAAHGQGIVHRDLKPDNVFLTERGGVKILDFGLARLRAAEAALPPPSGRGTDHVIVGTVGYMPPEQINGQAFDARGDLFALGATMYEMLTGEKAFAGPSSGETLHAVLTADPVGVAALNPRVPPRLAAIVARLLKKAPDQRFQSASDVAWALEQVTPTEPDLGVQRLTPNVVAPARRRPWRIAVAAILWVASLLVVWQLRTGSEPAPSATQLTQFSWSLPDGMTLDSAPSVAPDGRRIAFVARQDGVNRLFVRGLASGVPVALPGTEGARHPFWSPDGRYLGFFTLGKLKTVLVAAGAPTEIADARDGRGAAWSTSGTIVFSPDILEAALLKVASSGGPVEPATILDRERGDNSHRWPVFLPDGVTFLYFSRSSTDERRGIYVGRVDRPATASNPMLMQSESEVTFVPGSSPAASHLVYSAGDHVEVRPFDAVRVALAGDAKVLTFAAAGQNAQFPSMLSASPDILALVASSVPLGASLSSVLRDGTDLQVERDIGTLNWPRLSPDGLAIASQRIDTLRGTPDVWVDDLERGTRLQVTTSREADMLPVWSPDGGRLAYFITDSPPRSPGRIQLVISARDGTGVQNTIPCPDVYCEITDWTPDDRHLIVNVRGPRGADVWAVPVAPGEAGHPLLHESYTERDARVSPNGRWVSYVTEENGRPEIAVRTIAGTVMRKVVSASGGDQPVWRRDGAELFFVDPQGRLRSAPVRTQGDGTPAFGEERVLGVPPIGFGHFGTQYDVSPDGQRIYFRKPTSAPRPRQIDIVMGWRALLGVP